MHVRMRRVYVCRKYVRVCVVCVSVDYVCKDAVVFACLPFCVYVLYGLRCKMYTLAVYTCMR